MDEYVDSHYSNEEMQQLPHTPASHLPSTSSSFSSYSQSHQPHSQFKRSGYSSEPFQSPESVSYDYKTERSVTSILQPKFYSTCRRGSDDNGYSPTNESFGIPRIYPEVVYNMQLVSGSAESGYHGFDGISSSSTSSTNPRTPSRHGGFSNARMPLTSNSIVPGSLTLHQSLDGDFTLPDVRTTSAPPR